MAFTTQEEAVLKQLAAEYPNAQQITDLPTAGAGEVEQGHVEITTAAGESKKFNFFQAVHAKEIACRRWNETLATPVGEAWGNIDFLRALPGVLGLGCYLVADDRTKRKLDPGDHYKFADGSPALLDGSMGQYMWCWDAHWFCTKKEGSYLYEAVSLERLSGWECTYVPAGGTSALGFGVMDRETNKLCSLISDLPRYRGGKGNSANGHPEWDGTYKSMLGKPVTEMFSYTFSARARLRGLGWEANWYVSRAVQEYLFRIIMGTRNSQSPVNPDKDANGLFQGGLGVGVTQIPGSLWNEKFGYYPLIPCSAGVELADGVGEASYDVKDENDLVIYAAKIPVFFGLKHMWGNLWNVVRGLIINTEPGDGGKTRTYVARSMYDYEPTAANDATIEGMLLASEQPRVEGVIKKQSMNKLCCMPTEVGGSSSTYFSDYFWTDPALYSGLRSRLCGGAAHYTSSAGAFCANAHSAVSVAWSHSSLPLCFFEEDPVMA
ncbi:MAG: hypothetical protein LBU42_04240 [Prevotellaceae bacterium]|jgi:hypothetical protein|nr:hypothetical protein [Prevotellaceae bacterium]